MHRLAALLLLLASAAEAAPLVVYDDGAAGAPYRNGFQDYGWATRDFASTAFVHSGTTALAWEPDGFEAIYVHHDSGIDIVQHVALRGWVHGGSGTNQDVRACLLLGNVEAKLPCPKLRDFAAGGIAPGEWRSFRIPIDALADAGDVVDGFWFQDASGADQPRLHFDQIEFEESGLAPPPPMPIAVAIDTTLDRRPIDRRIYGVNFASATDLARVPYPINRWGGNTTSRYNWRFDVDNRGADYYFQRIVSGSGVGLPGNSASNRFLDATRAAGAIPLLTVPTIQYIANDVRTKSWSFSVAKYGAQTGDECDEPGSASYCSTDSGNGRCDPAVNTTGFCTGPRIGSDPATHRSIVNDPLDVNKPNTPQNATDWVAHLQSRYGSADAGGIRHYALDNEPGLWRSTHRDVHPEPSTYDEVWTRSRDIAMAIKAQDPAAETWGPVPWGWCEYFTSEADLASSGLCGPGDFDHPDREAHGNQPFLAWYLDQACAHHEATGTRVIDWLDIHYYPQGAGVVAFDGVEGGAATQALRLRSLKELYHPTYVAENYIGMPVRLVPRMKELIAGSCPALADLKLAITEYNWGPDASATGALAQGEALAIFGREGVDAAMRWVTPGANSAVEQAFRIFLDYDGAGAKVDGTSVRATSGNVDEIGAYGVDSPQHLFVLLFNKATSARTANLSFAQARSGSYALYRYADAGPLAAAGAGTVAGTTLSLDLPARSATLVVLPAATAGDLLFANGFE
ncbi:MAG TPA: glycoside hydrolase family 44 protein [Xanthomonadales bacterium]|nr:glycoside hydrolase family 44 protein [Xanthomonadales bacterium]